MQELSILTTGVSLLLQVLVTSHLFGQDNSRSGLYFFSHEVTKDERTSLDLTPDQAFSLPEGFTLEFDVNFRPGDGHYGNIFRIIGNDEINVDLVSNLASPSANFWLVLKDQVLFTYTWNDIPQGDFNQWLKFRIQVDTQREVITASLNGNFQETPVANTELLENISIQFGACRYKSFLNSDVSPMTLKDVKLYDTSGELFRHWELAKHSQQEVYDIVAQDVAVAHNPDWEIDSHVYWKKTGQLRFDNLLGAAKDERTGTVYFVNRQHVYRYHLDNAQIDTLPVAKGRPFDCQGNQIIYNPYYDEIWSYNLDQSQLNRFDFVTNSWSLSEPDCPEPDNWHHNRWISSQDSSLITFGGYGHYTYKSIIHQLGIGSNQVDTANIQQQIPPRYLSAAGMLNDNTALIFGGYGSNSGRQELSPQFYYDLYALNTDDLSVKKLWEFENTDAPFVPTEYLLPAPQSNSFYTLIYNSSIYESSLQLARFGIDRPEPQLFSDSIPYKFLDTDSWATFFLNNQSSELVALTQHNSEVAIHSLAYPPLQKEEVYQSEFTEQAGSYAWIIFSSLTIAGLAVLFLFLRKQRQYENSEVAPRRSVTEQPETTHHSVMTPSESLALPMPEKSAIYLLGGFQVFDEQGQDITAEFTPTLKQLFLMILLTTLKNSKGVVTIQMDETLWFDKSASSARNNRNVNLSKLRNILEKIGSIELQHEHAYWYVTLGSKVFCDYKSAIDLIDRSRSKNNLPGQEIIQLIEIVSRGKLCPGLQIEWLDKFKADFADGVIDALSSLSRQRAEIFTDYHLLLRISECMLKFDSLNEYAIALKCAALHQLGKTGIAKRTYDLFYQEYQVVLGEEYPVSFNELLHSVQYQIKKHPTI